VNSTPHINHTIVLEQITRFVAQGDVCLVGIDGRGGSGKSTLAAAIAQGRPRAVVVHMDDLYLPSRERPKHANTFGSLYDRARLIREVLSPLREGSTARYRRYDWDADDLAEEIIVEPIGVIIVEGITAAAPDLLHWYDITVWVETPPELCLQRGIERDGESARDQWESFWIPAEQKYIEAEQPSSHVDFVISGVSELR